MKGSNHFVIGMANGYASSHPDLFPPVCPRDDVPAVLALASSGTSATDSMEESNLTKGIGSRLWDRQQIDFTGWME